MSKHTLSVLVENTPGILARIAALFSRRGFNIDSLAVGVTEHPEISRITIEATGSGEKLSAMLKMLEPFGIKELVQSGTIAIGRGARSITDRSLRALDRSA